MSGKELFIQFTASAFCKLLSVYVFIYFPFGFEGRMWDLIVSVPDHCLSFHYVQWKAFKSPVVYTTDRSKAEVPMLLLFCVALQFTLRGASCLVLPCSLFMWFSVLLAFWSPCLGKRELTFVFICLLSMHTLICVTFSLPSGVGGWLRLLLVGLHGLFYLPFCWYLTH